MAIKLKVNEEQKELDKKYEEAIANGDPRVKKKQATFKHEMVSSRTPIEKCRKVIFIISCVALFIIFNLMLAPILYILFAFFLGVFWFAIVAGATLCTVGLVWLNEGFRSFEKGMLGIVNNLFNNKIDKLAEVLKATLPIALPICASFIVASFVLCTICFVRNKKGNTALFVISLIILILAIVFIIIALIATFTKK